MLISVVIPTCNRNDLLIKCLDLLSPANQTIDEGYQVLVTDDSIGNITEKVIKENYPWVKWIKGPKKGPASNRNNGAKQADGEWIVFIDDDCLPDKDILEVYKTAISNHESTFAFEGAIFPDDWDKLKEDMSECPVNTEGGCFWSANICVNKNVFKQIHGFDENFLLAAQEDQDIYTRILEKTKVTFIKDAFVTHPVRKISLLKKLKQIPIATRNWYLYEKKHNTQTSYRIRSMFIKRNDKRLAKRKDKKCHIEFILPICWCSDLFKIID
jgi:GT2 family glycosyltransferase